MLIVLQNTFLVHRSSEINLLRLQIFSESLEGNVSDASRKSSENITLISMLSHKCVCENGMHH